MRFENPYEILGLEPGASQEEVKAAYEKLLSDEEKKTDAEAAYQQILEGEKEETHAPDTAEEEKPAEEEKEEKPQEASEAAAPEGEKPEEAAKEEKPKEGKPGATPGQIALGVVAIVVLAAVLVALILAAAGGKDQSPDLPEPAVTESAAEPAAPAETTEATIPADGDPANETCKGSYSVSPEEAVKAADTVIASIGDHHLTNAQLQVYYWMSIQHTVQSNPYLSYMGLDLSRGIESLDTQVCPISEGRTWQQFFLAGALQDWQLNQAMAEEGRAAGVTLPEEVQELLDNLPADLEAQAKEGGFESAEAMLKSNIGPSATVENYVYFAKLMEMGNQHYINEMEKLRPDDKILEGYLKEHEAELAEGGITKDSRVVSARHILITPEDPESEDSWKKAENSAKDLLDQFLAGDKTEDSFAELASEHTMDPGSKDNGGLYEDILQGQMVPEFDGWCFDAARKTGDTDIVKTEYGYHIMYYVSTRSVWKEQVSQIYMQEKGADLVSAAISKHPMDVDYGSVVLSAPEEQ